jgi:hypothetical protein
MEVTTTIYTPPGGARVLDCQFSTSTQLFIVLLNNETICFYRILKSGASKLVNVVKLGEIKDSLKSNLKF